ncbi:MAG: mannitol dehydrogenase family protein [Cucumibacter sp.]
MTERLSNATLARLPQSVRAPGYDRGAVRPGIVHLGAGAFHRAHQAVYVDELLDADPNWGIAGASLKHPDTAKALNPQDGLYTLVSRGAGGTQMRVIGSLVEVLRAEAQRDRLMGLLTAEDTRIVSLTITEKGYCHDPATGELNLDHPDIVHDLAHPDRPGSAPGLIVAALAARRALGLPAFTVLSCDNLPANGIITRRVVVGLAHRLESVIGNWIKNETRFPSTMVDRMVPATTDVDRAEVAGALGLEDAWPVVAEPFSQWVIEDDFTGARPRFEDAGVQMVEDVAPFELMKLRMLNGSHSTLAYLGCLCGIETIAEAVADPDLGALVRRMMTGEVIPTLVEPGIDLRAYCDTLMIRFANPALRHRTGQIAMDGSQKLPQRLLGTIRDRIRSGGAYDRTALGVAAFMRYVTGVDEKGKKIEVRDPLAARLAGIYSETGKRPAALAARYLGVAEIFGTDLAGDQAFVTCVGDHLKSLFQKGARETVRRLLAKSAG